MSERDGSARADRPLTPEQARMWLFDRLLPPSAATEAPISVRIRGPLSVPALDTALAGLQDAHESLRGRFPCTDGVPRWMIDPRTAQHAHLVDLGGLAADERERACDALLRSMSQHPFNLGAGPLWRPVLARMTPHDHALIIGVHHLLVDLWSVSLIVDELSARYEAALRGARPPRVEPLRARRPVSSARAARDRDYWRAQLAGQTCAPLALDHPRPALPGLTSRVLSFELPADLSACLRSLSTEQGVTLYVTLLAALEALIHCWSGHEDHVTVSVSAGRRGRTEERAVGLFTEILVLRSSTAGNPRFSEVLVRLRETVLDALDHSRVTFAELVAMADPGRDLEPSPLRQIGFSLHNLPLAGPAPAGLILEPLPTLSEPDGVSESDLWLEVFDDGSGPLRARLQMDDRLFEARTLQLTARRWENLLRAATQDPQCRLSEMDFVRPQEAGGLSELNGVGGGREHPTGPRSEDSGRIGDSDADEHVRSLSEVVRLLLGCESVSARSNFFRLGGDSMAAVRLAFLLRERFGVEPSLYELMTAPTIAAIADRVRQPPSGIGSRP